jgi:cytochrome c-type biogenesis protein CcmH
VTLFLVAAGALVLLSGLFFLFPRKWQGAAQEDLHRANIEWYRLRQQELAEEGDVALAEDMQLRLLEEESTDTAEAPPVPRGHFPGWILLPLVAVFAAALYYKLGAAPDVMISRQLTALGNDSTPEQMQALMQSIEERAAQRPDNLHYTAMLGRFYMGQEDYARAAAIYGDLSQAAPEDAQALAYAAQAQYLASDRQLSDQARMRAEQALAINPHQRTALGLLGMASFEQGMYRAAIEYWQRLLAVETPGSESAQMIQSVIGMARQRLGEPAPAAGAAPQAVAATAGAGVSVRVELPDGAAVAPGDTVFVLARNAASDSRMPIAVQRLQGAQLPLTLRLDDSNSMAGQKLSETESVLVVVQVSPDGSPGEANASWLGQAGPLAPAEQGDPVLVVLAPNSG